MSKCANINQGMVKNEALYKGREIHFSCHIKSENDNNMKHFRKIQTSPAFPKLKIKHS